MTSLPVIARRAATGNHVPNLDNRSGYAHQADAGHRPLHVGVGEPLRRDRHERRKVVALPEARPRREDQQQTRFEQIEGQQQTTEQGND